MMFDFEMDQGDGTRGYFSNPTEQIDGMMMKMANWAEFLDMAARTRQHEPGPKMSHIADYS